jgi:YD repeat-containing protein
VIRPDGFSVDFSLEDSEFLPPKPMSMKLSYAESGFKLILGNGVVEHFDANGRLTKINNFGHIYTLTYDGDNVTVHYGDSSLVISLLSDGSYQVKSIVVDGVNRVSYSYAEINYIDQLVNVAYSDGYALNYLYEDADNPISVTGVKDSSGEVLYSVEYDNQGRAVRSEKGHSGSGVEVSTIVYNSDGTRTVTNALGYDTDYAFKVFGGQYKAAIVEGAATDTCAGSKKAYTYDANGFLVSHTDWQDITTQYVRDDSGRTLKSIDAFGTPNQLETTYTYDSQNRVTKIQSPTKKEIFTYDEYGKLLNHTSTSLSQ